MATLAIATGAKSSVARRGRGPGPAALGAAALLAVAALSSSAAAFIDNDPVRGLRMASVDWSIAADIQPRVWMTTNGNSTTGAVIVSKAADTVVSAWRTSGLSGVSSAPAAVAFAEGATQRQRVFAARNNALAMLPFDDDGASAVVALPNPNGFTVGTTRLTDTGIAAVAWSEGATPRIAVAATALKQGTAGFVCVWEAASPFTSWTAACTASAVAATSVADVTAVRVGSVSEFYFRTSGNGLGRMRRTGAGAYTFETITTPNNQTIAPSLVAWPSMVSGQVELGITSSGRVYAGRVTPTGTSPTWTKLPAFPGGAAPNVSDQATTTGVSFSGDVFGSPYVTMFIDVLATNNAVYRISPTDAAGTWGTSWVGPIKPTGQSVYGLGTVSLTTGSYRWPRVFVEAGAVSGSSQMVTLQELYEDLTTQVYRDHLRKHRFPVSLKTPATESSAAAGPVTSMSSAIRRDTLVPWRLLLGQSNDGANTWNTSDVFVTALPPVTPGAVASLTDPGFAYGGGKYHLVDIEASYVNDFDGDLFSGCTSQNTGRIVYRRGTGIAAMSSLTAASPDLFQIDSGDPDHDGVVVTEDSSGAATVHVVYWTATGTVFYWKLPPSGAAVGPTVVSAGALPPGPPGIVAGSDSTPYAWALQDVDFGQGVAGWPTICSLATLPVAASACGVLGGGVASPQPYAVLVSYNATCDQLQPSCPHVGQFGQCQRCFTSSQPVTLAADRKVPKKFYSAYQGQDPAAPGLSSIYFTRSSGNAVAGMPFGDWTPSVRINPPRSAGDVQYYFDPALTVDGEGTLVVTYSVLAPAPGNSVNVANTYIAWSKDGGVTWTNQPLGGWTADALPYHCGRKQWFLGEYRYGSVFGNRALHLTPDGIGQPAVNQMSTWTSRWSIE